MAEDERRVSWLGIASLLALLLLLAAGWGWQRRNDSEPESVLARIEREGIVRIGYANEAPYGYLDTATGEITGEAPEIAREILRRMGVDQVEPVVTEFGSLIPGLSAGRFDLIAAGMYITPARCQQIAFSNPTYSIGEAFVVAKGNPFGLHSFEDVEAHPRARLGVVGGAVEDSYARAVGVPEERIVRFPDNVSALTGVATGRVDAFAATSLTVHDLLTKADSDAVERAEPFSQPRINGQTVRGYGAFGFRKEDQQFVAQFNRHLANFIGTPEHLRLVERFGITEAELPGAVTAEQLCSEGE